MKQKQGKLIRLQLKACIYNLVTVQGSEAWPNAGLGLLKVQGKFNGNSNGTGIACICKLSTYFLHTEN